METCLRPEASCRFFTTIIRQRKKDIEKIEKYCRKNVRIVNKLPCY